jgi:hypothetical protein
MKLQVTAGTTDYTIMVKLQDSSSTTGAGLAGVAHGDITVAHARVETDNDVMTVNETGNMNAIANLTDPHNEWGWKEISAGTMPGWYRLDIDDGVLAAGAWTAGISITDAGANDIAPCDIEIQLIGFDLLDANGTSLTEAGGDGDHLVEAGGDGDQLTAINLPNQTMDIIGSITGNLSGTVGSVTGAVGSVTGAVGSVTGAVGSVAGNVDGNVSGSVASNLALGPTEVNAEVVDALATDTYAEPAQGAPGATISISAKIGFIYKFLRNKLVQDATTLEIFNDAGNIVDHKATVSDDGVDYTRGEIGTGP